MTLLITDDHTRQYLHAPKFNTTLHTGILVTYLVHLRKDTLRYSHLFNRVYTKTTQYQKQLAASLSNIVLKLLVCLLLNRFLKHSLIYCQYPGKMWERAELTASLVESAMLVMLRS